MSKKYIYIIENKKNKKKYIGQTKDFKSRRRQHLNHLKNNSHSNCYLQEDFNKYGEDSFSFNILDIADDSLSDKMEIYYISIYETRNRENGYNIRDGGDNYSIPKETKIKISETRKRKFSCGLLIPNIRKISEKDRRKISERNKGKRIRKDNPNHKKVICFNDLKVFDCILDASEYYSISRASISYSISNKKIVKNLFFIDYNEYIEKTNKYWEQIFIDEQLSKKKAGSKKLYA